MEPRKRLVAVRMMEGRQAFKVEEINL